MQSILGQQRATDAIQAALSSGRMHHAWIFAGPFGVGKCTTAIELARLLLDPNAGPNLAGVIEADPHGEVSRLIDARSHPDLHIIRKELARFAEDRTTRTRKLSTIPVDVLRQHMIGGNVGSSNKYHEPVVSHTPVMGHAKVFIIDEAQLLDATGQNAMLKTLEEPPPRTTIILITNSPERLLPTIRSRCQMVTFERLDDASMRTWMSQTDFGLTPDQQNWITHFAEGSPGAAQVAAEFGFYQWHERLEPQLRSLEHGRFPATLGRTLGELVDEFAAAFVKQDAQRSKDAANKLGCGHVLSLMSSLVRTRLHKACAAGEDPAPWMQAAEVLVDTERAMRTNVNYKQAFENLVVQWPSGVA